MNTIKYFQCRHCFFIFKYPSVFPKRGVKKIKCQLCSRIGYQSIWPSKEVLELLHLSHIFSKQNQYKKNISFVIVESTIELMLENLIMTMLIPDIIEDGAYEIITNTLLEGYQGRARLLSLFNKLGYHSFKEYTSNFGYTDYLKKWENIAQQRNMFVHGKFEKSRSNFNSKDKIEINIENFIIETLEVFKEINNDFIKEHLKYHEV